MPENVVYQITDNSSGLRQHKTKKMSQQVIEASTTSDENTCEPDKRGCMCMCVCVHKRVVISVTKTCSSSEENCPFCLAKARRPVGKNLSEARRKLTRAIKSEVKPPPTRKWNVWTKNSIGIRFVKLMFSQTLANTTRPHCASKQKIWKTWDPHRA